MGNRRRVAMSAMSSSNKSNVGVLVALLSAGGLLAGSCSSSGTATHGTGGSSGTGGSGTGGATGSGTGGSNTPGTGGAGTADAGAGGATPGTGGRGMGGSDGGTPRAGAGGKNAGNPTVHLDQPDQMIQGFGINDMFGKTGLPASLFDPTADIGFFFPPRRGGSKWGRH